MLDSGGRWGEQWTTREAGEDACQDAGQNAEYKTGLTSMHRTQDAARETTLDTGRWKLGAGRKTLGHLARFKTRM